MTYVSPLNILNSENIQTVHKKRFIDRKAGRNFYRAAFFLNQSDAEKCFLLYEFCRCLDDYADAGDVNQSLELIRLKEQLRQNESDGLVCLDNRLNVPAKLLFHLIDGFLFDQSSPHICSNKQLLTYCYQVAGTVGLMIAHLFDVKDPKALAHAVDLGIAMQLTNIARDVWKDAKLGRCYLPADWISHRTASSILAALPEDSQIRQARLRMLYLAENYYQSGIAGLHYLPRRCRFTFYLAAKLYRSIGVSVQMNSELQQDHEISKTQVCRVGMKAMWQYWRSDFCQKYQDEHQDELHQSFRRYASQDWGSHDV